MWTKRLVLALALGAGAQARAQDLMELLAKGPLVLVENNPQGKFDKATAVIHIKAPAAEVWKVARDFAAYKDFLPKVLKSEPKVVSESRVNVAYEIEVPGPNTQYTFQYDLEPAKMEMKGRWVAGDIKDSFVRWRVVSHGGECLVYYTTASRNYSSLAESLEDDQQTVTVGVNVASALAVVRAIKRHIETSAVAAGSP